jgi:multidrug efflux pump subunit AcrA (membrane-fusion protein)
MLNLSDNRIEIDKYRVDYHSLREVSDKSRPIKKLRVLTVVLLIMIGLLFLPWTQNVRAPGDVTTLYLDQRPQTVAGRIEKWHVREGEFVEAGDTVARISEIKDAYFDPKLIDRTQKQIDSKELAASNYGEKSGALLNQIASLKRVKNNKLQQAANKVRQSRLKVISDSTDLEAAKIDSQIADRRLDRMEQLYDQGLKSLTDFESRKLKFQEASAKAVSARNRLMATRNELENAIVELESIENEFSEKINKTRSEQNTALSSFYNTQSEVAKMENELSNYEIRRNNYFITAPQKGYITKAISAGIGETIKEGTALVSIMPAKYDLAVELYVEPINFPLLDTGNTVSLLFDGWPSIVFSGWPNLSNGTFKGQIIAIDNFISDNGKYRFLVVPAKDANWPEQLRVGAGANGILLLKDVPLWYELWRQLNGFPPDFYGSSKNLEKNSK